MRVALDVTPTIAGSTGVARYARELQRGLGQLGVEVLPFAIGRGEHPAEPGTRRIGVPLRVVQRAWQLTGLPRAEHLVGAVDLAHCLDLQPVPSRAPRVMTAHDLLALTRPDLHSERQVAQQRAQLEAFRTADLVLSNSSVTAQALVDHGVPSDLIVVTPLGMTPPETDVVPATGRYLLAVGELAARKNLPMLIGAFKAAQIDEDIELILVGPEGHAASTVLSQLGGRVRSVGRVDDARLAALYRGALVFCFPSLAEGFGLPVLEAMQAGAPVLASDLEVLREVAGDVAAYAPAEDPAAWTAEIERLVRDADRRHEMSRDGRARAAGRTWAVTAQTTLAAYERVLA